MRVTDEDTLVSAATMVVLIRLSVSRLCYRRTIMSRRPDSALGRLVRNADEITMATVATALSAERPGSVGLGSEMAHYLGIASKPLQRSQCAAADRPAGGVAGFGPFFAEQVEEEIRERTLPWLAADRVTVRQHAGRRLLSSLVAAAVLLANELGSSEPCLPVSSCRAASSCRVRQAADSAGQPRLSPGSRRLSGMAEPLALVLGAAMEPFALLRYSRVCRDTPRAGANLDYVRRLVKFLLWQRRLAADRRRTGQHCQHLRRVYAPDGQRRFDYHFMGEQVYQQPFTVVSCAP